MNKELNKANEINKKIEKLTQEMLEYARYVAPAYQGSDKEEKRKRYYELQKEFHKLREEKNRILEEEAKQRVVEQPIEKTFVNSYGEATKREITSTTYKREQKRQDKQLMGWC